MDESSPYEPSADPDSENTPSTGLDHDQQPISLRGRAIMYAIIAIVGGAVDLASKQAIFAWRGLPGENDVWWIIEGYFGIETAVNIGAVFGIGQGKGTVFAMLSIVAAIGIVVWLFRFRAAESLWLTVALGMITGGIIGNLYDRLGLWWQADYPVEWSSGVRDWILWQASNKWVWPNFNIADSLLVVGAGMLLYHSFFLVEDPESATAESNSTT